MKLSIFQIVWLSFLFLLHHIKFHISCFLFLLHHIKFHISCFLRIFISRVSKIWFLTKYYTMYRNFLIIGAISYILIYYISYSVFAEEVSTVPQKNDPDSSKNQTFLSTQQKFLIALLIISGVGIICYLVYKIYFGDPSSSDLGSSSDVMSSPPPVVSSAPSNSNPVVSPVLGIRARLQEMSIANSLTPDDRAYINKILSSIDPGFGRYKAFNIIAIRDTYPYETNVDAFFPAFRAVEKVLQPCSIPERLKILIEYNILVVKHGEVLESYGLGAHFMFMRVIYYSMIIALTQNINYNASSDALAELILDTSKKLFAMDQ